MRVTALLAIVACAAALLVVVLGNGEAYVVHARFQDAGQLIEGANVNVAGRKIGTVTRISLTSDGQADIELQISDADRRPLHLGTRATIRSPGLASIASRFVDLAPGPKSSPRIASGSVLSEARTQGIVDLPMLLNMLDPPLRADIRSVVRDGHDIVAGSGARHIGSSIRQLPAAAEQTARVAADVASDTPRLRTLVATSATVVGGLARETPELSSAITSLARTVEAVASERRALAASLAAAPEALQRAQRTLTRFVAASRQIRPTLRAIGPVAVPLRHVLARLGPTLAAADPQLRLLNRDISPLHAIATGLRPLSKQAIPALDQLARMTSGLLPLLPTIRAYAPDFVLGVVNGLAGVAVGSYDATGQYGRLEFPVSPQSAYVGALGKLPSSAPLVPGEFELRTGLDKRCPGAAAPPAPDGSNPIDLGPKICDLSQGMPASVNRP